MNKKVVNPITVLCFTKQVTLGDLQELVRTKARELYHDAMKHDLEVTGPIYWVYYGMNGKPDTVFNLEIALPVFAANNYKGKFRIRELGLFKYVSACHEGDWSALPGTYGKIFGEIGSNGYTPSGECREIYQHIDFVQPGNNITEVQVGIM